MTDTTDIAALREAAMKATPGPWSVARDGSVISSQYHPLATVSDGFHRLRSDGETGKDAEFIALANPATILAILDMLEAERQRAERGEAAAGIIQESLIKEREHSANFEREANLYHEKCETAEAEIAALKAKLANPVVLPNRRDSDPAILTYTDAIKAINVAGFTVKGE